MLANDVVKHNALVLCNYNYFHSKRKYVVLYHIPTLSIHPILSADFCSFYNLLYCVTLDVLDF